MTATDAPSAADGQTLRRCLEGATRWLEANAAAVDALNVYPVPDGDTGSNMLLTMRAGLAAVQACGEPGAAAVADALARGTLLGARGNSGVILSQICRGFAEALALHDALRPQVVADAFRRGAERAYAAVAEPVEGTILTVARCGAEAAQRAAPGADSGGAVLAAALAGAQEALRHTPEQLPVLREAGVVDAGGQGLVLLLEGALAGLHGRDLGPAPGSLGEIDRDWLRASLHQDGGHDPWGYCTQFVVEAPGLSADALRERLPPDAASVLVVADDHACRVHLHTMDPGAALSAAVALGPLHNVQVDNMSDQNRALAERQGAASGTPAPATGLRLPVVAVAPGPGLADVFTSLGAAQVVPGGQTMNPSVQQMAEAARAVPGDTVILLPNNPNVRLVCEQVHAVLEKRVIVVPSRSVQQGIAALLNVTPTDDVDALVEAMCEGLQHVRGIDVTTATRTTTLDGEPLAAGEAIALVDGELAAHAATWEAALQAALDKLDLPSGPLVTVYYGMDVSRAAAETLAASVRERPEHPEVELVHGGQPHYPYLVSVEA